MIDSIARPALLFEDGQRRGLGRDKRPMLLVFAAFLHPLTKESDLCWREFLFCLGGRHALLSVGRGNSVDEFAVLKIAGDDGPGTGF